MVGVPTGNTLLGPSRLSGDYTKDYSVLQRWLADMYDQLVKASNVIGTTADLHDRMTKLETRVTTLEAEFVALRARVHALDGL